MRRCTRLRDKSFTTETPKPGHTLDTWMVWAFELRFGLVSPLILDRHDSQPVFEKRPAVQSRKTQVQVTEPSWIDKIGRATRGPSQGDHLVQSDKHWRSFWIPHARNSRSEMLRRLCEKLCNTLHVSALAGTTTHSVRCQRALHSEPST